MKFGSVENPESIDFSLPEDHPDTLKVLQNKGNKDFKIYVGCAKWNKQDLKNFYPRGTKDELQYYATQFNSIELNATFYQSYPVEQIEKWVEKTPEGFKFFPKINQGISHLRRLNNVSDLTEEFCNAISHLQSRLGMVFLQVHDNFKPKDFERLENFISGFPKGIPLAVELRNTEWFNNQEISERVYQLFEKNNVTNIIVDSAGRRDLLHMRLTTPIAFIRYVGANHHPTDYTRLHPWIDRIEKWKKEGVNEIYFFMHQNVEMESPKLAAYFIEKVNPLFNLNLKVPQIVEDGGSSKGTKGSKTNKR